MAVHIGGLIPPQIDELRALCDERGIALVEDAAHAHGATFDGRFAGSFGAAAAFSFYPTKVVTSGEGGMVLTGSRRSSRRRRGSTVTRAKAPSAPTITCGSARPGA